MAKIRLVSDVILTNMARSIRKKSEQHILEVSVALPMLDSYNLEDVLKVVFLWPLLNSNIRKLNRSCRIKTFLYTLSVLMRSEVSASAVSTQSIAISWR